MMKQFLDNSYLFGGNAPFIEELYESYLVNPASVTEEWREYFDKMQVLPGNASKDVAHAPVVESFVQRAKRGEFSAPRTMPTDVIDPELDADAVIRTMREAVTSAIGARLGAVALIPPRSIPKTSSGKVQRGVCRTRFVEGTLPAVAQWQSA